MTTRPVITVFAKPPQQGVAKTRLIPLLGAHGAADLARAFLLDTWSGMTALTWARAVLTTPGDRAAFSTLLPGVEPWEQGPGDLGDRMERMLRRALSQAPLAFCVGSDSPGLPPALLDQARDALTEDDAVLGPAEDGGYFLIGLRDRCPEGLLAALPWSRDDTLEQTRARLQQRGLSVALTDPWFDVDRPEDLQRLDRLLRTGEIHAPRTADALDAWRGHS